jgi:hypothetical protein
VAFGVVVPSPFSPDGFQPQLDMAGAPGKTFWVAVVAVVAAAAWVAAAAGAKVPAMAATAAAMVMPARTPPRALPLRVRTAVLALCPLAAADCRTAAP